MRPADRAPAVSLEVDRSPRALGSARAAVQAACTDAGVPEAVVDDVALAVSELVTNAQRHTGGPICLGLRIGEGAVLVEVTDDYLRLPYASDPGTSAEGGRGLMIVQHLAVAWGAHVRAGRKTVWAEFEC